MLAKRFGLHFVNLALVATCAAGWEVPAAAVETGAKARELATAATIEGDAVLGVSSSSTACGNAGFSTVFCEALKTALDITDTFACTCAVATDTTVTMSYVITIDSSSDTDTSTVMGTIAASSADTSSMATGLSYAYSQAQMSSIYSSLDSVGAATLTEITTTMAAMTTTMAMATSDGETTSFGGDGTSEMPSTTTMQVYSQPNPTTTTTTPGDPTTTTTTEHPTTTTTTEHPTTTTTTEHPTTTTTTEHPTTTTTTEHPTTTTTTEHPTTTTSSGQGYWEVKGMVSFYVEDPVAACEDAAFTDTFTNTFSGSLPNYAVTTYCTSHIDSRRLQQHAPAERRLASDMSFFYFKGYSGDACSTLDYEMYVSNGTCMEDEGKYLLYEILSGELSIKLYSTSDCSGVAITTSQSAENSCTSAGDGMYWMGSIESVARYARVQAFQSDDCSGNSTEYYEALIPAAQDGNTISFDTSTNAVSGLQPTPVLVGICYPDEGMSYKSTEVVWDGTAYTYQAAEMHYNVTKMTAYEAELVYNQANQSTADDWSVYVDLMQNAGFNQTKWFLARTVAEPSFVSSMDGLTTTTTTEAEGPVTTISATIVLSLQSSDPACDMEGFTKTVCAFVADGTEVEEEQIECTCSFDEENKSASVDFVITIGGEDQEEVVETIVDDMIQISTAPSALDADLATAFEAVSYTSFVGITSISQPVVTGASDGTTTGGSQTVTYIRGNATMSVSDGEAACSSEIFKETVCSTLAGALDVSTIECSCAVAATESVLVNYTITMQGEEQDDVDGTVSNINLASQYPSMLTSTISDALSKAGFSGFTAVTAASVADVTVEVTVGATTTTTTLQATTTTTTEEPLVSEVIEENVTVVEGSASVEVEDAEAACADEDFTGAFCEALGDSVGATPECSCTPESSDRRLSAGSRRLAQSVSMSYEITIEADSEVSVETVTANIETVSAAPETFAASFSEALTKAGKNITVAVAAVAAPTTKTVTIVITRTRTSTITTTVPTTTAEPPQYDDVEVNATAIDGTATMGVEDAAAACADAAFTSTICSTLGSFFQVTPECTCTVPTRRLKGGAARRLEESVTITYTITIEDGSDTDPATIVSTINTATAMGSVVTSQLNTALSGAGVSITISSTTLSSPTTRATTMIVQRMRTTTTPMEDATTSTILNEEDTKLTGTIRLTVDGEVTTNSLKAQAQTALLSVLDLDTEVSSAVVQVTIEGSYHILTYSIFTQDDVEEATKALTAGTDEASTFLAAFGQALTTALSVTVTGVTVADFQAFNLPTTTTESAGDDSETDNCLQAAPASMVVTALLAAAAAAAF